MRQVFPLFKALRCQEIATIMFFFVMAYFPHFTQTKRVFFAEKLHRPPPSPTVGHAMQVTSNLMCLIYRSLFNWYNILLH